MGNWQAVLLEEDWVVLRDMGAYVAEGGRRGENLVREYDAGMRIRLRRPLSDRARRMPAFEVPCRVCAVGHRTSGTLSACVPRQQE